MASSFKQIKPSDRVSTRTLLHEAIPLTGTIVSGTYSDENIKNYSHGMFQSVYDYPYLSSSANHIFDITAGYANGSVLSGSSNDQNSKKINIYTEMSQMLVGYDVTGSVLDFDEDGNLLAGGAKLKECLFVNFSRLLYKDEIKKGTFSLELGMSSSYTENGEVMYDRLLVTDYSGSDGYLVNSPLGEYGVLYVTASTNRAGVRILANDPITTNRPPCGLIYYQKDLIEQSNYFKFREARHRIYDDNYSEDNHINLHNNYLNHNLILLYHIILFLIFSQLAKIFPLYFWDSLDA